MYVHFYHVFLNFMYFFFVTFSYKIAASKKTTAQFFTKQQLSHVLDISIGHKGIQRYPKIS